ncbi:pentatricopeptide repeat-containing protein At1g59720, chloroplastic/mitochondrial [Diospyros lotus]|uniref:pentatricopeptide repeat-containing protein At1g59720, chloroplastic/mitochondrial n=1 Tax=Diospyros lotus TaxID=55363 RepID=UPI002250AEA9|nr:pentatricopeptide repeat-containing protein At1g59720, chloroplastic/mitochondrial [Diospyros lotus]
MVLSVTPSPPSYVLPFTINDGNASFNHRRRLLHYLGQATSISQLKQIHAQALRTPPSSDYHALFLYSRILHSAASLDLDYASRIFDQIGNPNSFIWNTLIRAFARSTHRKEEAIIAFRDMLSDGSVAPDNHTFPFVLKACAYLFAFSEGRQMHAQVLKLGLDSDVYASNSLIHFYGTCGQLDSARDVFDKMTERSVVSWNVMIDALVQLGEFETALQLFAEMQSEFNPDAYSLQSVVNACAGLGDLTLGTWAHAYALRRCDADVAEDEDDYVLLNSSLVDMYCKCGSLDMAKQVFERMPKHDVNSWNSMILGLAMHGQAEVALEYFAHMVAEDLLPNSVTFVGVLSACNHRGMVTEGRKYFDAMIRDFKIEPVLEHYGCLVDLLARAGFLEEALTLVSTMPMKPDVVIWRSLLDACCKKNAGVELSEEVARQVIESEGGECSGVYVLLSRVYASASRWDEVGLVRKLMTEKGVTKEPGCSSIQVNGIAHEFFAGDTSHPHTKEIYELLDEIEERLKSTGYVPDFSQAPLVHEPDQGKTQSLRLHSERLAIAFGLLNSKPGVPIRVFKNLRVCNDCHNVTKLISCIYNVEIIVRDRARFHHFKHGSCSCMDYW